MQETNSNLTLKRAARLLGVHEQTLRSWEKRGIIRLVRLPRSGYRRVPIEEVRRLQEVMAFSDAEETVRLVAPQTDAQSQADARALADAVCAALQDIESSLSFEQMMTDRRGRSWSP